jgi:hypothetical protein
MKPDINIMALETTLMYILKFPVINKTNISLMQTSDVELTLISINWIVRFDEVTDLTKKINFREVKITVLWDVTLLCQRYVLYTGTHVTD